jgi:hypothetical protein
LAKQDYRSRRHLQQWLLGVSQVIHEAFSMKRWLRYSGATAILKDLQSEIQRLYDIIGEINLLLYWSAPWWQNLGPVSHSPITPGSAQPALWRTSPQALLQSTPAASLPQDNRVSYTVFGSVDHPQGSGAMNSADLINTPESAPATTRVSPDIKAGKNGAWPSLSLHPHDFIKERRLPPGYESSVLHDITRARLLAGEAGAILRAMLPTVFSFQRGGRTAVLGMVNPPDHHPAWPASNVIGEYLQRGIGPQMESISTNNGILSWEGGEAWPGFALEVTESRPRQTISLSIQGDEPEVTGVPPEYQDGEKSLDGQTGETLQDAHVLTDKSVSGKPTFPDRRRSPRRQPFKVWSPQIARSIWTKEEVRRQFSAVRSQVTPAVSFIPSTAAYLITEQGTAIGEMQKGDIQEQSSQILETTEVSLTPVPLQSPETHTLPIARNQMVRMAGEIRRQFNAVRSQTGFSADLRLPTMPSTLAVSSPLPLYSYSGQDNIHPEWLIGSRDPFTGLSEVVTQLTEEVKAANRRSNGQGKHEVHNVFNVTVETSALEAEDSGALSQKLGKLLAHEARRYGINL